MSATTIDLYTALVNAGINKEDAEAAAKAVISREEALERLASKSDLVVLKEGINDKIASTKTELIQWMFGLTIANFFATIGALSVLINIAG